MKDKNLGELEALVLAAVLRQGGSGYGASIKRDIEERTGRTVSLGALYAVLNRLEEKSFVRSRLGAATPERGGRAKRHFNIEPAGRTQLERSVTSMRNMVRGLFAWPAKS